jgi:hypothetical protein
MSINDEMKAAIFDIQGTPTERYQLYSKYRYGEDTPAGWLYNDYLKIRFVTDSDGNQLTGTDRRQAMAQSYAEDASTESYYQAIDQLTKIRDQELAALPVGAPGELTQKVWQEYITNRTAIETNPYYELARRTWISGLKPQEMVDEHYRSLWWQIIGETKPKWETENGETWDQYSHRVETWQTELPQIAATMMPIFAINLGMAGQEINATRTAKAVDLSGLPQTLMNETTYEGYAAWQKNKDTVYDAVESAWDAVYAQDYYSIFDLSGAERQLAEMQFAQDHPAPPTTKDIWAWVQQEYPGKFTLAQVTEAMEGRQVMTPEENLNYGKTPQEIQGEDIWDVLSYVSPGQGLKDLKKAFDLLGGNTDDISVWYATGGNVSSWNDPQEFQRFHDTLIQAATSLGLQQPSQAELEKRVQAQQINETYTQQKQEIYGDDVDYYLTLYSYMSTAERRTWRKENADIYDYYVKGFYDWRDQFAADNPVWGAYYNPTALTPEQ